MIKDRNERQSKPRQAKTRVREKKKKKRGRREPRVLAYITYLRGSNLAEGATRESPFVLAAAK